MFPLVPLTFTAGACADSPCALSTPYAAIIDRSFLIFSVKFPSGIVHRVLKQFSRPYHAVCSNHQQMLSCSLNGDAELNRVFFWHFPIGSVHFSLTMQLAPCLRPFQAIYAALVSRDFLHYFSIVSTHEQSSTYMLSGIFLLILLTFY